MDLERLMEVPVVGASKYEQRQSDVAAAVSVITREEIRAYGWRTIDEALASLPGMYQSYDRQYHYLGARGFSIPGDYNTRLLISVNGLRINDPVYDAGPLGEQLPLDIGLIERIELIPGPGGAVYGHNAMFGVVNIVTRAGASVDGTEVSISHASPLRETHLRVTTGKRLSNGVDVLLSAKSYRARGAAFEETFGSSGVVGNIGGLDGERDREIYARVSGGQWSAEYMYGHRKKSDPSGAYLSDPLVAGQFQSDRYSLVQAEYHRPLLNDTMQANVRLFLGEQQYNSQLRFGGSWYAYPAVGQWHGVEARLLVTGLSGHKLMLGLEAQEDRRRDQSINQTEAPENDVRIPGRGRRVGVFVQDEWRLSETVVSTLGLRGDHDSRGGTRLSPRLGLIWRPTSADSLRALWGRSHRPPNAYERDYYDNTVATSNPVLKGERIDTTEIVWDRRVDASRRIRLSAYRWHLKDLIVLGVDPDSGMTQYQSGASVTAHGVELSGERHRSSGWRVRTSLSWQRTHQDQVGLLVNSPQILARLNVSGPIVPLKANLGAELRYDSARRTLSGQRLGGHALVNLHLSSIAWIPGVEVAMSVRNLLGKRYEVPGADTNWQDAIRQDGRSLRMMATVRF